MEIQESGYLIWMGCSILLSFGLFWLAELLDPGTKPEFKELLEKYEEKLHLAEREMERRSVLERLADMVEGNSEAMTLLKQLGLEE